MASQNRLWASCPCCEIVFEEAERSRSDSFSCPNCRFEWFTWQVEPSAELVLRHRETMGAEFMARAFARSAAAELLGACRLAFSIIREGSSTKHSCPRCAEFFHTGSVAPCFCACHIVEAAIAKAEGKWPVFSGAEKEDVSRKAATRSP